MTTILLLLITGVIPVLTQYSHHDYQQPRYSDYGDFGRINSNEDRQQGTDFGIQQPSFFGSFAGKVDNDNHQGGSVSSLVSGSYGGLTPPPPISSDRDKNVHKYFSNERHTIVPSSLRELEESYIRSLSSNPAQQPHVGPFGELRNQNHRQQSQQDGVENYSGFIMNRRHYNKNAHIRSSQQQYRQNHRVQTLAQSAPITYGFPLLNQQASGTNAIDAAFGGKESGKYFDYSQKNIVPNFPDFSDRPPVPEEPEIPSEEEVEEATRKPPETYALPTPRNLKGFSGNVYPSPLASPPSIFDPSFPEPVLQRGFIPSFGPPTKQPFFPLKSGKTTKELLDEQELLHNQIASQEIATTSPVPVLRPEYPKEKGTNDVLPDEVSSAAPDSTEKPREGTIYKHISVHVPAEDLDEEVSAPKVIKVSKKPEKHIKVIFIKPPDSPTQKTEVEVPPSAQQKTLVYVLSESGGIRTPIKLVTPTPLKPAPPQVFFLRYRDPNTDASQPTPSSVDGEGETENDDEDRPLNRPSTPPPIKQLASPPGPDVELLRSAPVPVFPTFPSGFSSPASTAIAQQLALQSTRTSPTVFTNVKLTNPANGKYYEGLTSSNSLINDPINSNNQLAAFKYTNTFPPSSLQSQAIANPFSHNYYSSLYHLYPPPAPASTLPSQNLLSYYVNPNNYQQYRQQLPQSQSQFYRLDQAKSGTGPTPSSIQGLYTVAPNVQSLPGINFNSLVQNPDGKNPPRSPRNFVMMNYAPTYMPSASGSDHVPVFTSPAEFIKSLLGDSYMYYNNIANNSVFSGSFYNHTIQHNEQVSTTTSTTTTTTTTPAPPPHTQTQAQHHTIPLILSWTNSQNGSSQPVSDNYDQPFTLVVGNSFNGASSSDNIRQHLQHVEPVYPHLRPLFPFSGSTTPKPQPRISWAPAITPPSFPNTSALKQPQVVNEGSSVKINGNHHLITGEIVTSHFNNLFSSNQHDHHNSTQILGSNAANLNDNEQSNEYSQSESSSSETNESEDEDSSSGSGQQQNSGEEIIPIFYEPTKVNLASTSGGVGGEISSIIRVNSPETHDKHKSVGASLKRGNSSKTRKRVNPAHVKPGRRLRKVRKPHKNRKSRNKGDGEQRNQAQASNI